MRQTLAHPKIGVALLLIPVLFVLACAGPRVSQTAIDGRVNSISNWNVTWEHDDQPADTAITIKGLNEQSRYTLPEYCRAYVEEVAVELRSEHQVSVYRNMVHEGIIRIRLFGLKRYSGRDQSTDAERLTEELVSGEYDPEYDDTRSLTIGLPGSSDIIRRAEVSLFDLDDRLLGKILIGGDYGKEVKPSHIAGAIANALHTGGVEHSAY